jgi:hypothetical protein
MKHTLSRRYTYFTWHVDTAFTPRRPPPLLLDPRRLRFQRLPVQSLEPAREHPEIPQVGLLLPLHPQPQVAPPAQIPTDDATQPSDLGVP